MLSSSVSAPCRRASPVMPDDIGDLEHRVGRRFEDDHPHRPLPEHPLETVQIVYRQQAARDAEAAEHAPDQAARGWYISAKYTTWSPCLQSAIRVAEIAAIPDP